MVAGTSAGAAALPEQMLVDGYGWRALRKGGIQTGRRPEPAAPPAHRPALC